MIKAIIFSSIVLVLAKLSLFANFHQHEILENNIDPRDEGIIFLENGKAYLHPQRLFCSHSTWFFLNSQFQFVPIGILLQDTCGYYIDGKEPVCKEGHPGFRKVRGVWYCLVDGCPWFYGEHF